MTLSLTTAFALGLDGFIVCVALGSQRFGAVATCRLAMLFGTCDALAMLAGAAWGRPLPLEALVPGVVAGALMLVLLFPARARALAFLLPVPLALDNFVASAGHGTALPLAGAALSGAASAVLACAGLALGAGFASSAARFRARLPGASQAGLTPVTASPKAGRWSRQPEPGTAAGSRPATASP
jgi:putative Mn2+ efflux pump MntP